MALPENLSIRFDRKRWSAADLLPERLFLAFLELRVIAASCGLSCLWPSLQPITYFWTYAQKRVNLHRVFINKLADLGVRYSLPIKRCSTSVCHKSVFIFSGDFPLLVIHTFFFFEWISSPRHTCCPPLVYCSLELHLETVTEVFAKFSEIIVFKNYP